MNLLYRWISITNIVIFANIVILYGIVFYFYIVDNYIFRIAKVSALFTLLTLLLTIIVIFEIGLLRDRKQFHVIFAKYFVTFSVLHAMSF